MASNHGHTSIVTTLLSSGAAVDHTSERDGKSALLVAVEKGYEDLVLVLLHAGIYPAVFGRLCVPWFVRTVLYRLYQTVVDHTAYYELGSSSTT